MLTARLVITECDICCMPEAAGNTANCSVEVSKRTHTAIFFNVTQQTFLETSFLNVVDVL